MRLARREPRSTVLRTLVINCKTLLENAFNENARGRWGNTSRMTWLFVSATDVSILNVGRTDDGDSTFADIFSVSMSIGFRIEFSKTAALI
jgi:hypothetical protein